VAQAVGDLERDARHDARHDVAISDDREPVVHRRRAVGQPDRALDEAVAVGGAARRVVAIDESGVVLAAALARRAVEVIGRVAARGALRRIGEAAAGSVAFAARAFAPLQRSGSAARVEALQRRAGREDHGHRRRSRRRADRSTRRRAGARPMDRAR
jgi:hypothetical protein